MVRFATDLVSILDSTLEVGVGTGIPLMHPGEALETDLLLCAFLGLVLGAQSVVDGAVNNLVAGLDSKLSFEGVVLVAEGTLPILLLVLLDLVWNGLLLGFLAAALVVGRLVIIIRVFGRTSDSEEVEFKIPVIFVRSL